MSAKSGLVVDHALLGPSRDGVVSEAVTVLGGAAAIVSCLSQTDLKGMARQPQTIQVEHKSCTPQLLPQVD